MLGCVRCSYWSCWRCCEQCPPRDDAGRLRPWFSGSAEGSCLKKLQNWCGLSMGGNLKIHVNTCTTFSHTDGKKRKESSINPDQWSFEVTAKGPELNRFKHIDVLPGAPSMPPAADDSWIKSIPLIHSYLFCLPRHDRQALSQNRAAPDQVENRKLGEGIFPRCFPERIWFLSRNFFFVLIFALALTVNTDATGSHCAGPGSRVLSGTPPLWGIQCERLKDALYLSVCRPEVD